jgi:hypothetical protein
MWGADRQLRSAGRLKSSRFRMKGTSIDGEFLGVKP